MMAWYHSYNDNEAYYTCLVCGERFNDVDLGTREEEGVTVDGVTERLFVDCCPYCGSEEIA